MMNKAEMILEIIRCPICGGTLDDKLACANCKKKFSSRDDVFVLIDNKLSGVKPKWSKRIQSKKYREETLSGYEKLISREIKAAREIWWKKAEPLIKKVSGCTVDIATGIGQLLERLIPGKSEQIIATDIDPNILISTKREMDERFGNKVFYLATDAKHIALKDEIANYVTSFAGINNITDTSQVLKEIYRIMKTGGTFLMMEAFVDENTDSADLADDYGLKDAYIKDSLIKIIKDAGFSIKTQRKASSVIWKENQMDVFPLDGDTVYHYIIEAMK